MSTQTLYQSLLVGHLIGFLLFAGSTIASFFGFRQLWKQYAIDSGRAATVLQAMSGLQVLLRTGVGVIIPSGIGIMYLTHGVYGEQVWFRIKFALVLLVILNGIIVGRRLRVSLDKALKDDPMAVAKIRQRALRFHLVQLAGIFTIILLSVFKFN
ncbi:putative membrane protein DUF2214 [Chitinophaga polysaccharea]|uniref:Putative membrane protein DUF2214 n=1 Tax=Chitinophaga polysaccharea TaxID=1293035 RepID=A0A561P6Y4_9BACT|nr:DUF2214 family protein [Chitinophaga polysaccharea]TWF33841.1 putative membrane protein DUF2214 [Chitinophaga polysaccharea]